MTKTVVALLSVLVLGGISAPAHGDDDMGDWVIGRTGGSAGAERVPQFTLSPIVSGDWSDMAGGEASPSFHVSRATPLYRCRSDGSGTRESVVEFVCDRAVQIGVRWGGHRAVAERADTIRR
ncbi:hypothetical protein [Elioraea rosea]|uniref:hypothetical protein n=1 Tax=Elioraea rosea TaxID=2492390 RepID=UPI001183A464|nr:hypothetical protein [Elioraea rosea]